jgi:hypothetical protein
MTVNAIPMAKQTKEEVVENDLGRTLKSSKITSEIDFLKRMKLKQLIAEKAAADSPLKTIADFQSTDDKRIQEVYAKLIKMYQAAEDEKTAAVKTPTTARTNRNILANLYAQFGYKDLYEIAAVIAEIKRVKQENEDIMSSVDSVFK